MMTHTNNNQDFKPYTPEKRVTCVITQREAVVIDKLRKHSYGKFTIHKMGGVLVRIEINDSQLIDEDTETNLD